MEQIRINNIGIFARDIGVLKQTNR